MMQIWQCVDYSIIKSLHPSVDHLEQKYRGNMRVGMPLTVLALQLV
jgi:hypothetical protein